ncbi:MAG: Rne/Rng family ribonuclease [Clostridia bacterium]|nr:Rne/Rng family ribonuclease [Clostridia bacterium]
MRTVYVKDGVQREIAVVEDDRLVEYLCDNGQYDVADAVYLGRVERVVSGMNAAFVDIGQKRSGFLPLKEKSRTCLPVKLQAGMRILVQIRREAHDQKGAFLSRDITLPGQYVLLMPMNRYVGVSGKITDEAVRSRLSALGREIAGDRFGLVMRTSAQEASDAMIAAEAENLHESWLAMEKEAATAHAPSVITADTSLLTGVIRDYAPRGIDRVITDCSDIAGLFAGIYPVESAPATLMEDAGLIRQRDKALERFVWLKSGGSLMIDPCEAMTVIDVNTGKFTGSRMLEDTAVRLNCEACGEIARQLRLRNIGGVIVIDFIDMKDEASRSQVLEALQSALMSDRIKTVVHGFTSLGLVEMTRKRSHVPLRDEWSRPCSHCGGSGRIIHKEDDHG